MDTLTFTAVADTIHIEILSKFIQTYIAKDKLQTILEVKKEKKRGAI